jgi:hypothetical protein
MEKLFMSAGVVIAIVLCVVGLLKLPFDKFKDKHPKWYKAIFTLLSIFISVGLCVLDEMFILCGKLISLDFIILVFVVLAGVFGGYSGVYEGLGLKELMKKLTENAKKARELAEGKKAQKYLDKYIKKSDDIEKGIAFLQDQKNKNNNGEV